MNTVIRYSEAFKMKVVSEIEVGKWHSMLEAREGYGIGGKATVQRWVRTYGKKTLQTRIVRVQIAKEIDQVKALKRRVKELEKALATTTVRAVLNEAYVEEACEQMGLGVDAFKKKADALLLHEPSSSTKP